MDTIKISVDKIKPDKNQPRKKTGFTEEEIKELSNSIKEVGMIVPILIQKDNLIIDGERRWRAAKSIGLKEVPVIYNNNLTEIQRLEYQLICSLNATSCAEEEIAPKIKEYIDKSGFSNVVAATRLGKTEGYIRTMINQLADLNKEEKEIIKLWRDTKGEKGLAPSNLAELKQQHPERKDEIIEIAKEEVVSRSDIRKIAAEKRLESEADKNKKAYEEAVKSKNNEIRIIRTSEVLQSVREEIINTTRELDKFFYKVKAVKFANLSYGNRREQKDFNEFVEIALNKAKKWVKELERIMGETEYEIKTI